MTDMIFYHQHRLAVGRLWILTLLIMNNTRCQSWMSDEEFAEGKDECAMRGLFVVQPMNRVRTCNLQNPSGTRRPTGGTA